jgi:MFS family permease
MVRRIHYALLVAGVVFLALLVAAGVRGAPGVLIKPLESEFGWDRASISLAVAVSILAFGLGGPLGGALVDRFGARRVFLVGTLLLALGLFALVAIRELWQFHLLFGVALGLGTGAVSQVIGTTVAHRWFRTHRGLVIGAFGAATSAGQLLFIPAMMALTVAAGWRGGVLLLAAASLGVLVPLALVLRDRPEDVGTRAYGEGETVTAAERAEDVRRTPIGVALRSGDFWLLAGSFFVCGYTSNGLVGTHLIPHALEHGFTEVVAAGAVGLMGGMNILGTLASGWLSDRYDNRRLLAVYYGFRALSIAALPFIFESQALFFFAIVYGLDWIATVPPTANLTASIFGRASLGTLYGWIFFSHMVGAALAAYAGGFFRQILGDYHLIFISAAILGFIAVALSLRISRSGRRAPVPAPAY